jgi:putative toxin-antitoxin system antitoxin component (TIGR02293 family)
MSGPWRRLSAETGLAALLRKPVGHPSYYAALLGYEARSVVDLLGTAEEGMSYDALARLARLLDVPEAMLAGWLGIAMRTFIRRRHGQKFDYDDAERLIRMTHVLVPLLRLLDGDARAAGKWLQNPNLALGGVSPCTLLHSGLRSEVVEKLANQLRENSSEGKK